MNTPIADYFGYTRNDAPISPEVLALLNTQRIDDIILFVTTNTAERPDRRLTAEDLDHSAFNALVRHRALPEDEATCELVVDHNFKSLPRLFELFRSLPSKDLGIPGRRFSKYTVHKSYLDVIPINQIYMVQVNPSGDFCDCAILALRPI